MAQPKRDAPEVMPSGKPLRYISVDTNADMFGASIGRAISQLGSTVESVGATLAANQEKMRSDTAKSAANQAIVTSTMRANEISAEFGATAGNNAVTAYKPYTEQIMAIRQEALDSLGDDEAKELFDAGFQTKLLSDLDAAAIHTATQHKQAIFDSAQAIVDLAVNESSLKPGDDTLFRTNLNMIDQRVQEQGEAKGWAPEVVLQKQHEFRSFAWEARVTSMARTDARGAKALYDEVRDGMTVESRLRLEATVSQALQQEAVNDYVLGQFNGTNSDARPGLVGGIHTAGRNVAADDFLLSRLGSDKGAESITDLHPYMSDRLAQLINAAPPGIRENITVFSGFRSNERQAQLFAAAVKRYGSESATRAWVAPPGRSQHNRGAAVDIGWKGGSFSSMPAEASQWLRANAAKFGLAFPLGNEPWHIELADARKSGRYAPNQDFVSRIRFAEGGEAGVSSPAGAVGIMQVMPATARGVTRALGIPFDEYRLIHDDNYNMLIGTTYLNQMLELYSGNEWLAAAAYNAGPGAVNGWLRQYGDPRTGAISNEAWAAQIPYDETRGYVSKVMQFAGPYNARPITAQTSTVDFAASLAHASAYADMVAPGDSIVKKQILTEMENQYNNLKKIEAEREGQNYDAVLMAAITPNAEGDYPISMRQLAEQGLQDRIDALDATQKDAILTQLRTNENANAPGAEIVTDASIAEKDRLLGMYELDPARFRKENLAANTILTQSQKNELVNLKYSKKPKVTEVDFSLTGALAIMKDALNVADGGDSLQKNEKAFNQFVGAFSRTLTLATREKGKKLTQQEIRDIGQLLLSNTTGYRERSFWERAFTTGPITDEVPIYTMPRPEDFLPGRDFVGADVVPEIDIGVPEDARQKIVDAYVLKFGRVPTPGQVKQIYQLTLGGAAK